jgi:hypothetical protein
VFFRQCTPPVEKDAEEYSMNHEKRGRAIIFNHEKYRVVGLNLKERTGTNVDKIRLKQQFEKLKFDVVVFDDLTYDGIKENLTQSKY